MKHSTPITVPELEKYAREQLDIAFEDIHAEAAIRSDLDTNAVDAIIKRIVARMGYGE